MITDFDKIRQFGGAMAKDYALDLLRLLFLYKDISASEAASRLGLHIRTVQEFFDALYSADILKKEEVFEQKRPYYRYSLKENRITIEMDIPSLFAPDPAEKEKTLYIRERKNASVRYSTSRNNLFFSSVSIWMGSGRERQEKKVSLTRAQGRFLYNMPFPNAEFLSVEQIMEKAEIPDDQRSEITDIINLLIEHGVIEAKKI